MATQANQELNSEPSISTPRMWRFPTNAEHCCIYRVPRCIRKINPEAYTPQLVILGPLHHSLKAQALTHPHEDTFMGYLSMEQHKKVYLSTLAQRFHQEDIISRFRSVIQENEETIRASYAESTTWIESQDFLEMILQDSVFILEFMLRCLEDINYNEKTGDILMDERCLCDTIHGDLILLENQLPYFILEKLFDPLIKKFYGGQTFRKMTIQYFGFEGKMNENSKFKHFTDLFRCVRVDSLKLQEEEITGFGKYKIMKQMYNAEKLSSGGIKFKVIEEEFSLDVKFENGYLEQVPLFEVHDRMELITRNIMALEQCHYPYRAYVCNFILFLNYLIDTDKDVDFLVEKGIIKNWMGDNGSVADMVNKLSLGTIDYGSYCYDIALKIEVHYKNPINRSCALLKRVYFKDMWTGTATVAATFLLILTLIQTITSLMQVVQK